MSMPFTEAQSEQLQKDAQEFLEVFGKEYLKMFAAAMLERTAAEVEGEAAEPRKLSYRDWDSVERPELYSGFCYMKSGEGAGAFGKWKKVFLAETQDYNINIFKTDKDYAAGKKPVKTISTCGLNLERYPDWHYKREMRILSSGMGFGEDGLTSSFSQFAWALTHPVRTNHIFQLHAGKDAACPCFGGGATVEPEEMGSDEAKDRDDWLEFMDRCSNKAQARDLEKLTGMAFDKAVEKMKAAFTRVSHLNDNGTETEMLVTMLVEHCLTPIRDEVLGAITGPAALKTPVWYKTRGAIVAILEKLVKPAWSAVEAGATKAGEKIEPVVKKGVGPIYEVKNKIKEKIRAGVSAKVGEKLGKVVSPFLKPIFTAFEKPLQEGFQSAKDVYTSKVAEAINKGLPSDQKEINLLLDEIPRSGANTYDLHHHCYELVDPLKKLVDLSDTVFGGLDPFVLRSQAVDLILETLDAAIFTLEQKIEADGTSNAETLMKDILTDFDYDVVIQKATFMKEVMRSLLITPLMTELEPVTSPIIDGMNSLIPEDMQDFLSISALFDEIVDLFVGEPIDNIVDAAYPPPAKADPPAGTTSVEPVESLDEPDPLTDL